MPGVVSVMVAKNVACFMGAFHRIWMSNAANSSAWIRSGSPSSAGQFGQLVQQGGVGAVPPGVFVQGVKLAGEGLAFAVQGDELLADAGTVGVSGLGGHAGRVVQFGDQVVLGGVGLLEPEPERGGLGVVAGLGVGGPGREEFSQPGGAAGGQGVGGQPVPQRGQEEVLAGGDGAGVAGDGGGVPGIAGIKLADVVGVVAVGAAVAVGAGDAAHPPLAQLAPDPGPQQVGAAGGGVGVGLVAVAGAAVGGPGGLGGVPGGPVDDLRVRRDR